MNIKQEMSHEQILEQQNALQLRLEEAPILYRLNGIDRFLEELRESLSHEQSKTTLFITGESGSGKELIAGQLIHEIQKSNPEVEVGYLSFGMAMRAARDPKMAEACGIQPVTREGVDYDNEDYKKATAMMDYLVERFYADESTNSKLVIVENVGYTYKNDDSGLDQGATAIISQMRKRNADPSYKRHVFLLGLIAEKAVQEATFVTRDAAAQAASPEALHALFQGQGIRRDTPFRNPKDVETFRDSRGRRSHWERQRRVIDDNMLASQASLKRTDYIKGDALAQAMSQNNDELTTEMLRDPAVRRDALTSYAQYLAEIVWNIQPPEHILITDNTLFPLEDHPGLLIPYYNSLTTKYALPLQP